MNSSVYKLGNLRVIDLTKVLDPETETRRLALERFNTGGPIPDWHTHMDITSHLGTHVECPYHHFENGTDVASLPLTAFMGRAIYIDFEDKLEGYTHISAADLDKATKGLIKEGDIVILDSAYKIEPFTKKTNTPEDKRLLIGEESAKWFKDKKVKCVGFGEGVSIENCNDDVKPFHDLLMEDDIVFLEVLQNLEKLHSKVFFMSYTPMPIKGLDSCSIRAYAIEGLQEFSE
ncbi:cyclase family protein [Peptoniphilus equinus]|uniref:Cyclase family protein n=1 Tax=Peptoniphilus equinus TaxID=3016343 RepID=A0ABY7QUF0_9FIRM|nr:cyclase family protein [Peptoniphilus equinus]WBW50419.1 cyclase family protein [Peptoniphilus equinus]